MKLSATVDIVVLGKESSVSESTGKEAFKLAIMQGSEAGSISCLKDVYSSVKPLHRYNATLTYDDKYNYARLTGIDIKSEVLAFK